LLNQKLEEQLMAKNQELLASIKELDVLKAKYQEAWNQMKSQSLGIQPSQRVSVMRSSMNIKGIEYGGNNQLPGDDMKTKS
jgi:hypothetical protein